MINVNNLTDEQKRNMFYIRKFEQLMNTARFTTVTVVVDCAGNNAREVVNPET